jgi:hypothetical protein
MEAHLEAKARQPHAAGGHAAVSGAGNGDDDRAVTDTALVTQTMGGGLPVAGGDGTDGLGNGGERSCHGGAAMCCAFGFVGLNLVLSDFHQKIASESPWYILVVVVISTLAICCGCCGYLGLSRTQPLRHPLVRRALGGLIVLGWGGAAMVYWIEMIYIVTGNDIDIFSGDSYISVFYYFFASLHAISPVPFVALTWNNMDWQVMKLLVSQLQFVVTILLVLWVVALEVFSFVVKEENSVIVAVRYSRSTTTGDLD